MAYELFFINKENLGLKEASTILNTKASESDDFFISKELMMEIKSALRKKGLRFQSENMGNEMEFNFPTFQIALFSNLILLSIPHWKGNHSDEVSETIEDICETLDEFGMSIYDPQSTSVVSDHYDFNESFNKNNSDSSSQISGKFVFIMILISTLIWMTMQLMY